MKNSYRLLLLLNYFSIGLMIPILSLLLIDKGCTLPQIAIVIGLCSLTVFILELPSGMLADMIGRKKIFVISGILYFIASLALLFLHGFALLIPIIILWGAGRAFATGSIDALMIDEYIELYGTDNLSSITSQLSVMETVGLSTGTIVGGTLPSISISIFPSLGTYDLNLIIRCFVCACVVSLTLLLIKESPKLKERICFKQHVLENFKFIKSNSTVVLITFSLVCSGFFVSIVETYWQPAYSEILPNQNLLWTLGLLSFGCFAFATIGNLFIKRFILSKQTQLTLKYTLIRLMLFSMLVVFSLQRTILGFGGCFFILYFLFGGSNIIESTMLNIEIPNNIRSSMLSFVSLVFQAGCMISPLLSSPMVSNGSIHELWLILGIALIVLTALIGTAMHFSNKKTKKLGKTGPSDCNI